MAIGYYIASVKISKQDVTGDDVSSTISNLLRFTLQYTDIAPITFEVLSRVEYSTYYQFQIKFQGYGNPNVLAASVDNYVRDYTLSSNRTAAQTGSVLIYDQSTTGNSLGYFNTSSGEYTLGYTPNVIVSATASANIFSFGGSSDAQLIFAQQLSPGNYQTVFASTPTPITALTTVPFAISGAFTPIKGETYVTYVTDSTTSDLTSSLTTFTINQSQSPTFGVSGSGISTLIYTAGDSNENPLYGNADFVEENPHYSKVDYVEYVLPERDFELILSGSGTKSNVKQYNYELLRSIYPRYVGTRTISDGFNLNTWAPNPNSNIPYGGGLGLKPNVERTTPYFLYFNRIFNTSPLLKDKASAELKYLIDENGEAYNLNTQVPIYQNLIGSFEVGKKAYASFLNNENTIYNTTQSILLSGQSYQPIMYSLSSSAPLNWSNNIDFINFDGSSGSNVPNFNSTVNIGGYAEFRGVGGGYTYPLLQMGGLSGFKTLGDYYDASNNLVNPGSPPPNNVASYFKFTSTPASTVTLIYKAYIDSTASIPGGSNGYDVPFYFYIQFIKNNTTIIDSKLVGVGSPVYGQLITVSTSIPFTPNVNDKVSVRFVKASPVYYYGSQAIYGGQFQINTSGLTISPAVTPYWSVDSTNRNIITSSVAIAEAYGKFIQKPIPNSGLADPNKIIEILPGDEFRFEYQEGNNVFKVIDVLPTSSGTNTSTIKVTLDRDVPNTIITLNPSHFLIRRKATDVGNGITLDVPYATNTSGGFLFPEYLTDKLKNDLPTIISNLQQKGLF